MALHDDFAMYYNGTYIGYRDDDDIVPLLVDSVRTDISVFDYHDASDKEIYSDEALNALVFYCVMHNGEVTTVKYNDPNLVLEMPDSQYIELNGRYYWVSWRASRSTKKGLTGRRLTGAPRFGYIIAERMFSTKPVENIFGGCMAKVGADLMYKGVLIGEWVSDTELEINHEAQHLVKYINKEIPDCTVTVRVVDE